MILPPEALKTHAEQYIQPTQSGLRLAASLGYGNDGAVWSTNQGSAIKAYDRLENYNRELACYERLQDMRLTSLGEFKLPTLVGYDAQLKVIEMTIVKPPYVLDFGKSYLDQLPDFSAEVLADWEAERSSLFEPGQWSQVKSVIAQLRSIGIYYFDAKPANIGFSDAKKQ